MAESTTVSTVARLSKMADRATDVSARLKDLAQGFENMAITFANLDAGTITAATTNNITVSPATVVTNFTVTNTNTGRIFNGAYTNDRYVDRYYNDHDYRPMFRFDPPPPETEEQREERQRRRDEAQQRAQEESRRRLERAQAMEKNKAEAQERGLEVLKWVLTPEEREEWEKKNFAVIKSQHGALFRVNKAGVHGNIVEVDEHGCELGHVCVAPEMYVHSGLAADGRNVDRTYGRSMPMSDGWVGQVLMIKNDEDTFRRRGNWSMRQQCRQAPREHGVPEHVRRDMVRIRQNMQNDFAVYAA